MQVWQHEPSRMSTSAPTLQDHAFRTTRWTRVRMASADSEDGRRALADLCDAYYEPVVAYLRRALGDEEAAREVSHAFFAAMLGGHSIQAADQSRGRFRWYLLGAVKHFISHQREAAARLKRGGGAQAIALDDAEAVALADERVLSPDAEFDRQWAVTVITRAMDALRAACAAEGRADFFEMVADLLSGHACHGDQAALAAVAGMSPDGFRMAVHRLKRRLRDCVKAEVAGTLEDPARVQEEMEALFAALAS